MPTTLVSVSALAVGTALVTSPACSPNRLALLQRPLSVLFTNILSMVWTSIGVYIHSDEINTSKQTSTNFFWITEFPNSQDAVTCNTRSSKDTANYLTFLKTLRQGLGTKLITLATGTSPFNDNNGNPSKNVASFAKVIKLFISTPQVPWKKLQDHETQFDTTPFLYIQVVDSFLVMVGIQKKI